MKKSMVAIILGLLVLGLAGSAMAEVAINGSYRARLWYAKDYDLNADKDVNDPTTYIDNRLRLLLDVKVAENVQVYGNFDLSERWFGGSSTDTNYQNFQVNEGYLKFMVPNTPVWLQIGRQDVSWYYGVLGALSDYRDRLKIWADLKNIGLNVGAAMDQNAESVSSASPDDDDSSNYCAWARAKVAGWDLGVLGVVADNGINDGTTDNNTLAYLIGIGANGAAGPVKIGFEAATKLGTAKTRASGSGVPYAEKDLAGYGALAIFSMPAGPVGVSLAVAYATGDDPGTTDKNESFAFDGDGPVNGVILWANNWAPNIAAQGGAYTVTSSDNGFSNGIGAKLAASFAPIKPLTVGVAALYAVAAQDPSTTVSAGAYGAEIDLTASYDIAQNVNLLCGLGYLMPGAMLKDLGYEDPAMAGLIKFEVKF